MTVIRPPIESFVKSPIQKEDLDTNELFNTLQKKLKGEKGDKPSKKEILEVVEPLINESLSDERLEAAIIPLLPDPVPGLPGKSVEIADLIPVIESLIPEAKDGRTPSKEELVELFTPLIPKYKEVSLDTPKEVVEKINKSRGEKIKRSRVEGLDEVESIARTSQRQVQNFISLGGNRQTKLQLNGVMVATGADTLNFVGGTLVPTGDGTTVTYTPSSSGGGGFQAPLSGGLTGTNTWTTAPNVIVVDGGRAMQKVSTDGTVNWTGTTTTILIINPNFDVFAIG